MQTTKALSNNKKQRLIDSPPNKNGFIHGPKKAHLNRFASQKYDCLFRLSTLQLTLTREIHTMIKVYQKQFASIKIGKRPMKPTIQAFKFSCWLLLLALAGCTGDPDRARIVGDWEIATTDHLMGQVNAQPDDQPPRMLIHFYNSGYLATETNMGNISTQKQGNWKLLSYDAQTKLPKFSANWSMIQPTSM